MRWMMIAAVLALPMAAQAGTRQDAAVTMPDDPAARAAREAWGYADAVAVDGTVYLSGVVALVLEGESTFEPAYGRAFETIAARLAKAGCAWDDVVEMTSYHTDVAAQMPAFLAVKRRFVRPPHLAWTAVGVNRLIPDKGITEIRVIARSCGREAASR